MTWARERGFNESGQGERFRGYRRGGKTNSTIRRMKKVGVSKDLITSGS